jgi:predicted ATPase
MIKTLSINGFKTLRDFSIDLGVVNVFIGANGSGKSNILEALGVLSAAASGRIDDESLMRRGVRPGLPRLYKSSFRGDQTPPHITLDADSMAAADYRVSLLNPLDDPKPSWEFKTETLQYDGIKLVSRGVRQKRQYDPALGLAALKAVELERENPASNLLRELSEYAIYSANTPALRGVVPDPQTREPLGLSGGRLAGAVASLQKLGDKDERIEEALDELLFCLDWVARFDTSQSASELLSPSIPQPKQILRFTDRFMVGSRNTLTGYDASEGALYILFAAALTLLPSAPSLLAIDNLDQALNPRLIKKLTSLLCNWVLEGDRQQLLCTTHNPAVIDGLDLTDDRVRLFAVDRDQIGHTHARRVELTADLLSLAEKNEWPLSRLWMMGHLGGVPNV